MEIQIKKTVKAGNSSAVILPRSWLNKEVRVELVKKTPEIILSDVINIIKQYISLECIIGIYLVGSYARREEDGNSDIDILIITSNIDQKMINNGIYNILIVSSGLLNQKLEQDLLPIGQMIKEAVPLLNSEYLKMIKINITKKNIKWYIDTTEEKLRIIKDVINKLKNNNKTYISDLVIYTLVLRIRTLYIIRSLIENQDYSKKNFIRFLKKISKGTLAYERYLAIKNNEEEEHKVTIEEAEKLYNYLKEELIDIKRLLKM